MRILIQRHLGVIVLVVLLVAGAIIAQIAGDRAVQGRGGPALSSTDAGPTGALALALWLEQLGFRVDRPASGGPSPSDSVRYFFVLHPTQRVSQDDARSVVEWVRRGGTLVYVPSLFTESALTPFEAGDGLDRQLDLAPGVGMVGPDRRILSPILPFFNAPPAGQFSVGAGNVLHPSNPAWISLVEVDTGGRRQVLVARRRFGAGQALAIGSDDFLSNGHLGDADNSAVILNLLARGSANRVAMFDEFHHGVQTQPDLIAVARASPWGWAIVYLTAVCFVFALWSGRRFGPPITREEIRGRSTGDYVTAFAGLLQRNVAKGSASAWTQAQYSRLVRRELVRSQGVRSDLPAPDLARILAERHPIDPAALSEHLASLAGPPLSDRALLDTIRSLEPILRALEPNDRDAGRR